ncbi:hypothetical protein R1sor_007721 [Riccia sorocarpa]|uniref:BAG domain-containing protein n=1 Tax=Riccia sorocarpa TaxID=122646 RepID=A0ABD3HVF6_9MARC
MLVAAAALFVVGHFANKRAGRRLGRNDKAPSSDNNDVIQDDNRPMSLAELRARRIEAAEARLRRGSGTSSPAAAKPTPLGRILLLAREVDKLESETATLLSSVQGLEELDSTSDKELLRLLELLTQVQLKIDDIESDESVRPHRRTQTQRVQKLILELEAVCRKST